MAHFKYWWDSHLTNTRFSHTQVVIFHKSLDQVKMLKGMNSNSSCLLSFLWVGVVLHSFQIMHFRTRTNNIYPRSTLNKQLIYIRYEVHIYLNATKSIFKRQRARGKLNLWGEHLCCKVSFTKVQYDDRTTAYPPTDVKETLHRRNAKSLFLFIDYKFIYAYLSVGRIWSMHTGNHIYEAHLNSPEKWKHCHW